MSAKTTNVSDAEKFKPKEELVKKGMLNRAATKFHETVTADGSSGFKAEPGRYALYASHACPWAHRCLITIKLKGLEDVVKVCFVYHVVDFGKKYLKNGSAPNSILDVKQTDYVGWEFNEEFPDTINGYPHVRALYEANEHLVEGGVGRYTVPILYDTKEKRIINNESAEIVRMFNSEFNEFAKYPEVNLYPEHLRTKICEVNDWVYPNINDGVYRCGFSQQEAYDVAVESLFEHLDKAEKILGQSRFLCGDEFTEADLRLFVTLIRFDHVYHTHFKCNKKKIAEYPNLKHYVREIYQMRGISKITDFKRIKEHYYKSHANINPTLVVPVGPPIDFGEPHNRNEKFPFSRESREKNEKLVE
jgi:putative glutathione S-transferase